MVSTIRSCRDFVFYFFAFLFDLHRPINFRDISDIDDRRKKAFDSRPSQLDSVFAFITRWLVTSRRLIFFAANEGNDSFPFPFFSLSLSSPSSFFSKRVAASFSSGGRAMEKDRGKGLSLPNGWRKCPSAGGVDATCWLNGI